MEAGLERISGCLKRDFFLEVKVIFRSFEYYVLMWGKIERGVEEIPCIFDHT